MRPKRLESAHEHACGNCKEKVTEKDIQCDGCDLWFHTHCVKITNVQQAVLDEVKKLPLVLFQMFGKGFVFLEKWYS